MKTIEIVLIMVCVLAIPAHAGTGLEVLTPPTEIGTTSTYMHIVGFSEAPEVSITVAGGSPQMVAVKDSIFHAHVWFGYGLQEVKISGPDSSAGAQTLKILSGPNRQHKFDAFFPPYRFHGEGPPKACLSCHAAPEEVAKGAGADAETAWCLKCHDEVRELIRSHVPDREPTCRDCHDVRPDLTVTSIVHSAKRNPCYSCHEDKIWQFDQAYIHGPVAGNSCTVCHSPHGSRFEKNLLSDPGVLCASCHPMVQESGRKVQHLPFLNGKCVACHNPHATSHRWVLVRNSEELCLTCHQEGEEGDLKNHSHPYNVKPQRRLAQTLELTSRGRLECLSCHDPHATEAPHLLRSNQVNTCAGCHPGHQ